MAGRRRQLLEAFGHMHIINPYRHGLDNIKTDMVGYWTLNETTGTRSDSHNSYDLTETGTVSYTTGKKGNCAVFPGSADNGLGINNIFGRSMLYGKDTCFFNSFRGRL